MPSCVYPGTDSGIEPLQIQQNENRPPGSRSAEPSPSRSWRKETFPPTPIPCHAPQRRRFAHARLTLRGAFFRAQWVAFCLWVTGSVRTTGTFEEREKRREVMVTLHRPPRGSWPKVCEMRKMGKAIRRDELCEVAWVTEAPWPRVVLRININFFQLRMRTRRPAHQGNNADDARLESDCEGSRPSRHHLEGPGELANGKDGDNMGV